MKKVFLTAVLLCGMTSCGFLSDLQKRCVVQPYSYTLDSVNICLKCDSLPKFLKELRPDDFKVKK